jgi:ArsR family transcriptional regulator, arsenate/arsenite/antimonite-responsive transcriptional repressor
MEISKSVELLASLAQESRLLIFKQLVQAGPDGTTPMQLAEYLAMPPATLSFHLKELYRAGLCNKIKQGRNIIYSADFNTMQSLIDYLLENCCSGGSCITENHNGEI